MNYDGQFFLTEFSFSNFNSVLHILFGIFLTLIDRLNEFKFSRDSLVADIKSLSNRRCHKRCCRCCSNCLLLLRRRESHFRFLHFRPSVFLFGCVWAFICFALVCLLISLPFRFSCYCLCSGHLSPTLTSITVSKCIKT